MRRTSFYRVSRLCLTMYVGVSLLAVAGGRNGTGYRHGHWHLGCVGGEGGCFARVCLRGEQCLMRRREGSLGEVGCVGLVPKPPVGLIAVARPLCTTRNSPTIVFLLAHVTHFDRQPETTPKGARDFRQQSPRLLTAACCFAPPRHIFSAAPTLPWLLQERGCRPRDGDP